MHMRTRQPVLPEHTKARRWKTMANRTVGLTKELIEKRKKEAAEKAKSEKEKAPAGK